jgi:hypothetical protein
VYLLINNLLVGVIDMKLPKIVQVTLDSELAKFLELAKAEQPLASWSKLLAWAAKQGFQKGSPLDEERLEAITPSLTEDVDYEELAI